MTENVAALDKVIDVLNSAASAGEPEQIAVADTLAAKVADNYRRLRALDTGHAADLDRLVGEFAAYYKVAREVSDSMAQQTAMPAKEKLQEMAASLALYRKDVATFRTTARNRFVGTVSDATDASDTTVQVGRRRLPIYAYSDSVYVGYTLPWVRVPQDFRKNMDLKVQWDSVQDSSAYDFTRNAKTLSVTWDVLF